MTKKKAVKKKDETIDVVSNKRKVIEIILQQSKDGDGAHYFIKKDGTIVKGIDIDTVGKHCKDNDKESIGIVLEGKYTLAQQKALMNVLYQCFKEVGEKIPVKPFNAFYPGTNPDLNIRSLMMNYAQTYEKKTVTHKPVQRIKRGPSKREKIN